MKLIFEKTDNDNFENFVDCKDVNTSGIRRFGRSALLNATHLYYVYNNKPVEIRYFKATDEVKDYIISSGVNHSPDDWTGHDPRVKSFFAHLNEKYLKDLRDQRALLLLDQSLEGYQTEYLWKYFHEQCAEWGVHPKCIVYVTGNMIADSEYFGWAVSNNISEKDRIKVIPYPHFELDMGKQAQLKNLSANKLCTFDSHIFYKEANLEKIKPFACLNKRVRNHRVWFFKYMMEAGLLDKGLISMNEIDYQPYHFERMILDNDTIQEMMRHLPMVLYGKRNNVLDDSVYINRFNVDVCHDTYMSVISEAQCGDMDKTMFLSEKTFKVIANRHPFMIMGNKDSMAKMREIGYETFDGFIDEGYDSLPTHERLEYICQSIQKVIDIPDKMEWFKAQEEIIEHNYETLIGKLYKLPSAYIELNKYYKKFINKII